MEAVSNQGVKCRLLQVPIEIRVLIYHLVFAPSKVVHVTPNTAFWEVVDGDGITSGWSYDHESFAITRYEFGSQLLRTCTQLYTEGLPFLYSQRTFNLAARESTKFLLHNIQPKTFGHIRHIELEWDGLQEFAWSLSKPDYLLALSGLQTIEMSAWRNRHINTTSTRWRNAKGYERMICQAAADILLKHPSLCVLVEQQFVRKSSITNVETLSLSCDPNPIRRVKWRFLSSSSEIRDGESVVDISKNLETIKATQDEATDGGLHMPMIDPF